MVTVKCFLISEIFARLGINNSFYDFDIKRTIEENNLNINFYNPETSQKAINIANIIYNDIMAIILSDAYYFQTAINLDAVDYGVIYKVLITQIIIKIIYHLNPYLPLLTSESYQAIIELMTPGKAIRKTEIKSFVETAGNVEQNAADNNYSNKDTQTNTVETAAVDSNVFKEFFNIKQMIAKTIVNNLFFYRYNPDDFDYIEK